MDRARRGVDCDVRGCPNVWRVRDEDTGERWCSSHWHEELYGKPERAPDRFEIWGRYDGGEELLGTDDDELAAQATATYFGQALPSWDVWWQERVETVELGGGA
ncbi:MAG: hypothetical protein GY719_34940 [bacterium]|nr:hypothetical protein [bacterium]